MIKYKCRIKTEKEFIQEFGESWRDIVDKTFPRTMDVLLGIEITQNILHYEEQFSIHFSEDGNIKMDRIKIELRKVSEDYKYRSVATITYDMIVIIKLKPTYTTKKIIHG